MTIHEPPDQWLPLQTGWISGCFVKRASVARDGSGFNALIRHEGWLFSFSWLGGELSCRVVDDASYHKPSRKTLNMVQAVAQKLVDSIPADLKAATVALYSQG